MVQIVHPEKSYEALEQMVGHAEAILQSWSCPTASWCCAPATWASARPRPTTSRSGCRRRTPTARSAPARTAKLSRRPGMQARFKNAQGKNELVHTLNGSGPRGDAALVDELSRFGTGARLIEPPSARSGADAGAGLEGRRARAPPHRARRCTARLQDRLHQPHDLVMRYGVLRRSGRRCGAARRRCSKAVRRRCRWRAWCSRAWNRRSCSASSRRRAPACRTPNCSPAHRMGRARLRDRPHPLRRMALHGGGHGGGLCVARASYRRPARSRALRPARRRARQSFNSRCRAMTSTSTPAVEPTLDGPLTALRCGSKRWRSTRRAGACRRRGDHRHPHRCPPMVPGRLAQLARDHAALHGLTLRTAPRAARPAGVLEMRGSATTAERANGAANTGRWQSGRMRWTPKSGIRFHRIEGSNPPSPPNERAAREAVFRGRGIGTDLYPAPSCSPRAEHLPMGRTGLLKGAREMSRTGIAAARRSVAMAA